MRPVQRRAIAGLSCAFTMIVALVVPSVPSVAAGTAWSCDSSAGLGHRTPVLLVHGYTSSASTWSTQTKQYLASNPARTCVSTFDYGPYSTDWVTNPNIGPALAGKIMALASDSSREGGPGKVIIVAHSMGGLAVRCAADAGCSGVPGVAGKIRGVVTFGTPNLGTWIKSWGRSDLADIVGPFFGALCVGTGNGLGTVQGVCDALRAFTTSAAVKAFTPGSAQLRQLPPMPKSIPVLAVAGSVKIATSFFGHYVESIGDIGDIVVSEDSAVAEANVVDDIGGPLVVDCGYIDITQPVITSTLLCSHLSETHDESFLTAALGLITKVENQDATQPVTLTDLRSAPVPALRGNPAGGLVNGSLPLPPDTGNVSLQETGGGTPAFGDLTGDHVPDAAALINATSGVGGNDEYIELYTNRDHRLGEFDPANAAHQQHAHVIAMAIKSGEVLVDFEAYTMFPAQESSWSVHLRWNGHSVVASQLVPHTGATGRAFWTDPVLTITPRSLGAVRVGMTLAEAQVAAGVPIQFAGDGVYDSPVIPVITQDLHLHLSANNTVACVGAGDNHEAQTIVTPEGVRLGDTVQHLLAAYGTRARYVSAPTTGMTSNAGYIVAESGGSLALVVVSNTIVEIEGGGTDTTPNSCTG